MFSDTEHTTQEGGGASGQQQDWLDWTAAYRGIADSCSSAWCGRDLGAGWPHSRGLGAASLSGVQHDMGSRTEAWNRATEIDDMHQPAGYLCRVVGEELRTENMPGTREGM